MKNKIIRVVILLCLCIICVLFYQKYSANKKEEEYQAALKLQYQLDYENMMSNADKQIENKKYLIAYELLESNIDKFLDKKAEIEEKMGACHEDWIKQQYELILTANYAREFNIVLAKIDEITKRFPSNEIVPILEKLKTDILSKKDKSIHELGLDDTRKQLESITKEDKSKLIKETLSKLYSEVDRDGIRWYFTTEGLLPASIQTYMKKLGSGYTPYLRVAYGSKSPIGIEKAVLKKGDDIIYSFIPASPITMNNTKLGKYIYSDTKMNSKMYSSLMKAISSGDITIIIYGNGQSISRTLAKEEKDGLYQMLDAYVKLGIFE